MDNRSIHNLLNDLEKKSQNDFDYLESTGAQYFSTGELRELRGRWRERQSFFREWHRAAIILGASSPGWIILGFVFGLINFQVLASTCLLLFPISFFAFIGMVVYLKRRFRSRGYQEHIGRMIEAELLLRQNNEMTQKRS